MARPPPPSRAIAVACAFLAGPSQGCEIALVLTIDTSGSIDRGEYRIQTEGLADALADPEVADALVLGQVALAVVQWSGTGQQSLSLPWRRMLSHDAVADFSADARGLDRAFAGSDTAVGEAIAFSTDQFAAVADCRRRVVDISGDGPINAGRPLGPERNRALEAGIAINAVAIEDAGQSIPITEFYRRAVITPGGFVLTARGLTDYPRAIREKLLREVSKPLG
ncbi:MAG TPA: DUF1194 domain-containing protein [Albidovulum sp.]|uniref:DUF1194 domain-containing protein n=1 Tax=Albidovulum sp. TaxID=1872424 RepID=UPI002CE88BAF|nr:DUF1194 domain-containing protein [Albidovulum sp.]